MNFYLSSRAYKALLCAKQLASLVQTNYPLLYPVLITLTFAQPFQPQTPADLKPLSRFIDRLRYFFRKNNWIFFYYAVKGVQQNRNSLDIHILLWLPLGRKIPTDLLKKWWQHGRTHITKAYNLRGLIDYLVYENADKVARTYPIRILPKRCRLFTVGLPKILRPRYRYALIPRYAVRELRRHNLSSIGIAKFHWTPSYFVVILTNGYTALINRPPPFPPYLKPQIP